MAKERQKRLRQAIAEWLRSSSDLVTYATSASRIVHGRNNAEISIPGVVFHLFTSKFLPDNDFLHRAQLTVTVLHTDSVTVLDMIGAIEELSKQSGNSAASFSSNNIAVLESTVLSADTGDASGEGGAGAPLMGEGTYTGQVILRLVWRED